jgi:hypothetical protein
LKKPNSSPFLPLVLDLSPRGDRTGESGHPHTITN